MQETTSYVFILKETKNSFLDWNLATDPTDEEGMVWRYIYRRPFSSCINKHKNNSIVYFRQTSEDFGKDLLMMYPP